MAEGDVVDLTGGGGDANESGVTLSVGEVTTLVWLVDLALDRSDLPSEASELWGRMRSRLTTRTDAVVGTGG